MKFGCICLGVHALRLLHDQAGSSMSAGDSARLSYGVCSGGCAVRGRCCAGARTAACWGPFSSCFSVPELLCWDKCM